MAFSQKFMNLMILVSAVNVAVAVEVECSSFSTSLMQLDAVKLSRAAAAQEYAHGHDHKHVQAQGSAASSATKLRGTLEVKQHQKWEDPKFFDSFSVGESTWNYDGADINRAKGNPYREVADGYNPLLPNPFLPRQTDAEWFHESESAGPNQALQTHYPSGKVGLGSTEMQPAKWFQDKGGVWIQDYKYPVRGHTAEDAAREQGSSLTSSLATGEALGAAWFDASVNQVDSYGRLKDPFPGNPTHLLDLGYKEQSVNTSVSCAKSGCTASSLLHAFQKGQKAEGCKLTVLVQATDFGDNGMVKYITVNGRTVSVNCAPRRSDKSCKNASLLTELQPCARDIDIQQLVASSAGELVISAHISKGVSNMTCAHKGNLLYAVPQVTCMVHQGALGTLNLAKGSNGAQKHPMHLDRELTPKEENKAAVVKKIDDINRDATPKEDLTPADFKAQENRRHPQVPGLEKTESLDPVSGQNEASSSGFGSFDDSSPADDS
eukprot:TRINITY_DN63310_c0_g1_i1.p1 TRINITY_DN63310_c0_g1~~TRINITY_DN63310_c0_g1_i1.p1  ORF type:complete len:492 (+),score=96.13 TRINITY_DN63310_c0_g1_i1:206-1681(+)